MIPSVDERLASVIRALSDVVLTSLPPEAGLAKEQVQLSIGQLQILRAQLDRSLAFEAEELDDAVRLGEALAELLPAGAHSVAEAAQGALAAADPSAVREARIRIHDAMAELLDEHGSDPAVANAVIAAEKQRVVKERAWFAPYGFDIAPPTV